MILVSLNWLEFPRILGNSPWEARNTLLQLDISPSTLRLNHQIFTQMYLTVSMGPSYMEGPTGLSKALPPQTTCKYLPTFHISLESSKTPPKEKQSIKRFRKAFSYFIFPLQRKIFFWRYLHFSPHWNLPQPPTPTPAHSPPKSPPKIDVISTLPPPPETNQKHT